MDFRNLPSRLLNGCFPVIALLVAFWLLAVTSIINKSATFDEPLHLAGGYGYWTQNEYKLSTENGNLAQRWATLPLLFGDYKFPVGKDAGNFKQSFDFLFNMGNNAKAVLFQGRFMISLLGVLLGVLVFVWSSRLFGRAGGLISLMLYAFSPTMLAHSRLATSDLVVTLCFTASLWFLWQLIHRVNIMNLAASCLSIGALFVAKMSAVLIIPIGFVLLGVRLISLRPLPVGFGKTERLIKTRRSQLGVFLCLVLLQVVLVTAIVSAFYGFRYSATKAHAAAMSRAEPGKAQTGSSVARTRIATREYENTRKAHKTPSFVMWALRFNRKHHLLPEAYLQGLYVVATYSLVRPAFFNGKFGEGGWPLFFPYCFLVKTPLSVFVVLVLAAIASFGFWYRSKSEGGVPIRGSIAAGIYRTSPLWIFLLVYWIVAVNTDLNIGQRHILPVYPATFILAGAAGYWFNRRDRLFQIILTAALAFFVMESFVTWPNYLAYFNQIAGGPENGYRHLVDSSLDWGQDLPGLKAWLKRHGLEDEGSPPVYLSYFGNGDPMYYGIDAERLPGYPDLDLKSHEIVPLQGGVYCISATMLQMIHIYPAGPWNEDYERAYQALSGYAQIAQFAKGGSNRPKMGFPPDIEKRLQLFPNLQLGRLCAYLRNREPDDYAGYSILIYRLSDREIQEAMFMPFTQLVERRYSAAKSR